MTLTWLVIGGLVILPFYVRMLAMIAARAWYAERRRYHENFIHELKEPS